MMPALVNEAAPVPPPAYHRAQARLGPALHIDALTLVNTLHLLTLCRLAVRLAHRRCPPPLPAGLGERLAHTAMSRCCSSRSYAPVFRLSYRDMRDWLRDWPALALACGLPLGKDGRPRIPCASQQCKRGNRAGAPRPVALFVLTVLTALRGRLMSACDLIIDSVPILAWRRADPDAADCACSCAASSSAPAWLPGPSPHLSWFGLTTLFSPLSCQCP